VTNAAEAPIFVDSHAHLDDGQFERDLAEVIGTAAEVGVQRIVNIGYRPARWRSSIELSRRFPGVSYALGLHPNHADEFDSTIVPALRELIRNERPVAIGEIGLDYFRDHVDAATQQRALAAQLELAAETGLPVVFHLRGEVESDLLRSLQDVPPEQTMIFHSFDASEELAAWALSRDAIFGVGGLLTRKSSERLRAVIAAVPLERIVLETDSPYLVPAGFKDRRNTPASIPAIAAALAELKTIEIADVAAITTANAERAFRLAPIDAPAGAMR
jgi:TatD DNase family protein